MVNAKPLYEIERKKHRVTNCCVYIVRPHVIASVLITGYILLGGLLFKVIEHDVKVPPPYGTGQSPVHVLRFELLQSLQALWVNSSVSESCNWTMSAVELLIEYEDQVGGLNASQRGENTDGSPSFTDWYTSCFFCFTVITTIGYGLSAPRTTMGQITCIIYAIIGVPLFLTYLAKLGALMAEPVKLMYCIVSKKCVAIVTSNDDLKSSTKSHKTKNDVTTRGIEIATKHNDTVDEIIETTVELNNLEHMHSELVTDGVTQINYSDRTGDSEVHSQKCAKQNERFSENYEDTEVPLIVIIVLMSLYVFICAIWVAKIEQMTYLESIYFCVITFSTIGFGDYVPNRHSPFLWLYIIIGLVMMAASFRLLEGRLSKIMKRINCAVYPILCIHV
ncbi:potassium channel subfamily K member 18-like [Saccoglossus kowalevskii]|uniref:Potassium channel subfamily K member 10-like n=1 Tax=Saccoglossus kowalevskii TaxID=10224 RepID=A0ABM0GQG1_SACKO|nr:PREDICTED: potassium channel subfamily K member 10-like [Saccoglossus kowalevskii]